MKPKKRIKYYHDPVHGTISFPFDLIQTIIDHPYVQRLRRITQCGLSHYVFPGANHTRFHHSLGVAHLAYRVLLVLRAKGIDITDSELKSTCIAALLHDIGHGPFSHALEGQIIPFHHETLSILLIEKINEEQNGALTETISILRKEHPKKFLSQLIASQLDVDRMDYLTRDSFYTGVEEGRLGLERLIQTFNVADNKLVTEIKALQTVEKFLVARHHMYWQVYLHKAVLCIQQMLILYIERIKHLIALGVKVDIPKSLYSLLIGHDDLSNDELIESYIDIDDISVIQSLKQNQHHSDEILAFICKSLIERKIFALEWTNVKKNKYLFTSKLYTPQTITLGLNDESFSLIKSGTESIKSYDLTEEIYLLSSDQTVISLSKASNIFFKKSILTKSFICYPRDSYGA